MGGQKEKKKKNRYVAIGLDMAGGRDEIGAVER
jgi:hypothetical protein